MKKTRVLIADDSDRLVSGLRIQLEAHGLEVATGSDAYMALAEAQRFRPDVMVLDIRMPAGDGFSVLERMRKIPELRNTPVIYMTGDKSAQLDWKAEQLGACGFLHKPISLSALLKMITSAAQRATVDPQAPSEADGGREFEITLDPEPFDIPGVPR